MEVFGIMIGIAIGLAFLMVLASLFTGLCWALWQLRYFIAAVMVIYIFVAIFSKYSHATELRSDICYTTMNAQVADTSFLGTLVFHEDLNRSENRVQLVMNQDTFSK